MKNFTIALLGLFLLILILGHVKLGNDHLDLKAEHAKVVAEKEKAISLLKEGVTLVQALETENNNLGLALEQCAAIVIGAREKVKATDEAELPLGYRRLFDKE